MSLRNIARRSAAADVASRARRTLAERMLRRNDRVPAQGRDAMKAHERDALLATLEARFALQVLGEFDRKTSSRLATPPGDRRDGRVFTCHNGADASPARGFRVMPVP